MDIFFEIGMLVIFAGLGTYLAKLTKQPLIPAYIISGVVIGNFFGILTNHEMIAELSEIGIAFLLFMVGLELDFKKIKDMGLASTVAGTVQMVAVFAVGYFVMGWLGFERIESIYLGLVIAFSSTMIVVKILSDKLETNTLHGRLTIGILVVQDIFAILALSYLTSVTGSSIGYIFMVKLLLVLALGVLCSKMVFPKVFEFAAKSRELLLTLSLGVCFLFALLFSTIGLSITIGAFFAGVLLANLPYNIEIVGKIKPLRDFFAILFFTSLGLQLTLSDVSSVIFPLVVLVLLAVVFKAAMINVILHMMRYQPRTAFLTSTSLAQISEFSIILVLQGVSMGVLRKELLTITILLSIITMTFTAYVMSYEGSFYRAFRRMMGAFGRKERGDTAPSAERKSYDAVLCGYDRIGYSILKSLREKGKSVVVVDFNPDVITRLKRMGASCIYGDICDPEVMERIDLHNSRLFISTANAYEDNLLLLHKVKAGNRYIPTIVTAHKIDEALELYRHGADYVILPHFLGGDMVAEMLPDFESNALRMNMLKYRHINDLLERKDVGHDHPTHVGG